MRKTKLERATEIEQMIERLKRRRTELLQSHKKQERDARTHRLCKRSGYLEKVIPELATLTDEQFEAFVIKTLKTTYAENALRKILPRASVSESPANNTPPAQEEKTGNNIDVQSASQHSSAPGTANDEPAKAAG